VATRRTKHRLRNWLIAGIVAVVVLAVGGPFVYIHFIEGPAPAKLTLPSNKTSTSASSTAASVAPSNGGTAQLNGTWNVGPGSVVGYRVGEVLIGQNSTAVGRTGKVWGSVTVNGGSVTRGMFTVNMATVTSDQSERNAQFDGRIMDVGTYPTAEFVMAKPILLGTGLSAGTVKHYPAAGRLTMHGVTKLINFNISMELSGNGAYVLAEIPIVFANWDISNPSVGGFVTTQNSGTLEVLLHLVRGSGNPAATNSSENSNGGGFGGPVTVPSTTVPPLTVPRS
jgi:polyisoprenoid-binding protein YceI